VKNVIKTLVFSLFLSLFFAGPLFCQENTERILSLISDTQINKDGSLSVREEITVMALGDKIKRGIYRDFPTKYTDKNGRVFKTTFDLIEVLRDGRTENYFQKSVDNGFRVYIGREDYFLPQGQYTYTFVYKTNRQIGFFKDHDELFWNAIGNGWDFQIETAKARVMLPEGTHDFIETDAYTGAYGQQGKDFIKNVSGGAAEFVITKPLAPYEGLSVFGSFKKGIVKEPTNQEKLVSFISDNIAWLILLLGVIIIFVYYIMVWSIFGKDPNKGVIIPMYQPPEGFGAAAVRYVKNMGFDAKVFTIFLLDMAIKGALVIKNNNDEYSLEKKDGTGNLSPWENKIVSGLFGGAKELQLTNANYLRIGATKNMLEGELSTNYKKSLFVLNSGYFSFGVVLSAIFTLVSCFSLVDGKDSSNFIFYFIASFLWFVMCKSFRDYFVLGIKKAIVPGVIVAIISVVAFSMTFVGSYNFSLLPYPCLFLLTVLNFIFYILLKAPTKHGREIMDKIDGLKMYLNVAEKDELRVAKLPQKKISEFEKFLPYAFAFDIENKWSEYFAETISAAQAQPGGYTPYWYYGSNILLFSNAGFMNSFGSSLNSAISSASVAPGSRSYGGGGGFSGGGGGGGGGGGW